MKQVKKAEKITANFYDCEIIPKDEYLSGFNALDLVDITIVNVAQHLREKFGRIDINNWYWNGTFQFSGFRPKKCKIGAKKSAHKIGKALDLKFKDTTPAEVEKYILDNQQFFYDMGLRRIESTQVTKTWLHIDMIDCGKPNKIYKFRP